MENFKFQDQDTISIFPLREKYFIAFRNERFITADALRCYLSWVTSEVRVITDKVDDLGINNYKRDAYSWFIKSSVKTICSRFTAEWLENNLY